jgi:hypothetical protein
MRICGRTRNQNPGQSGPDPGFEFVPSQGWPDPDSCFFFIFDFSFSLMPLNHEKKVEQKAKAKAKAKAIRTSFFFDLDVFFGVAYLSLSCNIGHFSFPSLANGS